MASNKKWWAIGGVGCLVFGLILTVAVVFAVLTFVRTVSSPKQTAEKFCSSLEHNNYRKAWGLLTPELQEEYNGYSNFKAFFARRKAVHWQIRNTQIVNDKATVEVTITSKSTGWEALIHTGSRLLLKKVDGKWTIYDITGTWEHPIPGQVI